MKTYITTKVVRGASCTDVEFSLMDHNGPHARLEVDKDNPREGVLVKYPGPYFSWCPKAVWERTAREMTEEEIDLIV